MKNQSNSSTATGSQNAAQPKTRQYPGEKIPRSLYHASRSGGSDLLTGYAFSVRQAFEQMGFQKHVVTFENGEMIRSKSGSQTYILALA